MNGALVIATTVIKTITVMITLKVWTIRTVMTAMMAIKTPAAPIIIVGFLLKDKLEKV